MLLSSVLVEIQLYTSFVLEEKSERGCAKVYLKLSKRSALHKKNKFSINLQNAGGQFDPLPVVFPKMCFLERVKLCFFVTLNIIISCIFPENFINIFNYLSINYVQKVQPY